MRRPPIIAAVSVALRRGEAFLMVRRGRAPDRGRLAFPGGKVQVGEAHEAAARRELREETGLEAGPLRLITDLEIPAMLDRRPVIYALRVFGGEPAGGVLAAATDASEALWLSPREFTAHDITETTLEIALGQAAMPCGSPNPSA